LSDLLIRDYKDNLKNLKFIKTDLEGADFTIFLTIKDLVKKYLPVIQSEINGVMSNRTRNSYIQHLKELDYIVFALRSETLDSIQELTQEMIDSEKTFDIFAIPSNMIQTFKEFNSFRHLNFN
tara:strand:+ start:256 stop:624 length:369 start_codon:yes stop_codon:yes gene_type:complete